MTTEGLIALGLLAIVVIVAVMRRAPEEDESEPPENKQGGDPTGRGSIGMWPGGDGDGGTGGGD